MAEEGFRPTRAYQKRLDAVAEDARELAQLIRQANILPPAFQTDSVLNSCEALIGLPDGTTDGSHAILETALERIGSWRFDYFGADEDDAPEDGSVPDPDLPTFTRGDALDRAMEHLASTITFALESERAKRAPSSTPPPAPVLPTPPDAQTGRPEAVKAVEAMGAKARDLRDQIEASPVADSPKVEAPKRALTDALNLRLAALSELYQTRIRPWILDRLASASPGLATRLETSGKMLGKVGAALGWIGTASTSAELGVLSGLALGAGYALTKTATLIQKVHSERAQPKPPESEPPPFDLAEAHAMILRGETPPKGWVPSIAELRFKGEKELSNLDPLESLFALERLYLGDTAVTDLAPLASLTALELLDLNGTSVRNLAPLANLSRLKFLHLRGSEVSDLSPLRGLSALKLLDLEGTAIADLAPLAQLSALKGLYLGGTAVKDLQHLMSLYHLEWLYLNGTAITDMTVAQSLVDRGVFVVPPNDLRLKPRQR